MTLPEIKDWHVETLRCTLFAGLAVQAAGNNWWAAVTGSHPEATVNRSNTAEYLESGEFLGGQFELKVVFNRIDLSLNFPFSDMPGAPNPGDISSLLPAWIAGVDRWLKVIDFPVTRVATGAVLFKKVGSIAQGNSVLRGYLPFMNIPDPDSVEDVLVQINSPSVFNCLPGMRHNRICKIAVLARQMITMSSSGFPTTVIDTVVRNELDMSSALENNIPIPLENLGSMMGEMSDAYLNILREGVAHDKI
jgi:hypothetical protein